MQKQEKLGIFTLFNGLFKRFKHDIRHVIPEEVPGFFRKASLLCYMNLNNSTQSNCALFCVNLSVSLSGDKK